MAPLHHLFAGLVFSTTVTCVTVPIKVVDLAFEPEIVQASAGDILEFHFMPHNHSVVKGDVDRPCKAAKSGGFYSGFFPVATGEADHVFRVPINDTSPFVFYCSQDAPGFQHCQDGMAGAVNMDNATLAKYKESAQQVDASESPATAFGGAIVASSGPNGTNPSTSATAATSSGPPQPTSTATGAAERSGAGGAGGMAALAALGTLAFAAMMV